MCKKLIEQRRTPRGPENLLQGYAPRQLQVHREGQRSSMMAEPAQAPLPLCLLGAPLQVAALALFQESTSLWAACRVQPLKGVCSSLACFAQV